MDVLFRVIVLAQHWNRGFLAESCLPLEDRCECTEEELGVFFSAFEVRDRRIILFEGQADGVDRVELAPPLRVRENLVCFLYALEECIIVRGVRCTGFLVWVMF